MGALWLWYHLKMAPSLFLWGILPYYTKSHCVYVKSIKRSNPQIKFPCMEGGLAWDTILPMLPFRTHDIDRVRSLLYHVKSRGVSIHRQTRSRRYTEAKNRHTKQKPLMRVIVWKQTYPPLAVEVCPASLSMQSRRHFSWDRVNFSSLSSIPYATRRMQSLVKS